MALTHSEIDAVCRLVNDVAGIQWDAQKTYLIESRLGGLLEDHRCAGLEDLVMRVRGGEGLLREAFVDAVTTRETYFFRDDAPYSALRNKALPEIIDSRDGTPFAKRLRIWSAACSSGQEPYSLAITLCEMLDDIDSWDIQVLATDLSAAALETARSGIFNDFEVSRGVSPEIRSRYFTGVDGGWRIHDRVRGLVTFQQRNLLEPFTGLGPFDVIFCRNVAIYFDAPTKADLFERLAQALTPQGAIFVGSSESLGTLGARWKPHQHCRSVFYSPNAAARNLAPVRSREAVSIPAGSSRTASVARPSTRSIPSTTIPAIAVRPVPARPAATRSVERPLSAAPALVASKQPVSKQPAPGKQPPPGVRPPTSTPPRIVKPIVSVSSSPAQHKAAISASPLPRALGLARAAARPVAQPARQGVAPAVTSQTAAQVAKKPVVPPPLPPAGKPGMKGKTAGQTPPLAALAAIPARGAALRATASTVSTVNSVQGHRPLVTPKVPSVGSCPALPTARPSSAPTRR